MTFEYNKWTHSSDDALMLLRWSHIPQNYVQSSQGRAIISLGTWVKDRLKNPHLQSDLWFGIRNGLLQHIVMLTFQLMLGQLPVHREWFKGRGNNRCIMGLLKANRSKPIFIIIYNQITLLMLTSMIVVRQHDRDHERDLGHIVVTRSSVVEGSVYWDRCPYHMGWCPYDMIWWNQYAREGDLLCRRFGR